MNEVPTRIPAIPKSGNKKGYRGNPITETITNGFFTVDRNWMVKYWNKAAEKLLDVAAQDIVGKNLWEKFSGILPAKFYSLYHQTFIQDIPVHFEEYWGEMGAWFDVITYHCDDTLSVSFKIDNRRSSPEYPEQQLKVLNDLYRFVTEVTNDCLWEWNLQTKEVFWIDGGHKRVFGYQIENALIPQSFWENHLHPEDKQRLLSKLNKLMAGSQSSLWEDEYRFEKAGGDYAFVHDRGHIIFDNDNKPSRIVGATQDISARKLLEDKLIQEGILKQKEITSAVLRAQEKEREEIGKELHDNLNQILVAAKLYIEIARVNKPKRDLYLRKSTGYIVDVIAELRKISKTLCTPVMSMGLVGSIENLIADLSLVTPMKIKFYQQGMQEADLDERLQLDLFRIVQEQLSNILKHAKARQIIINLTRLAAELILLVSDNGQGCDITKQTSGIGIINIKNRAKKYDGKVSIISWPGNGYELSVVIPLGNQDD
jgi:PAS domain S-box-containing protein